MSTSPQSTARIQIDDELLSRNMHAFLRSPAGRSVLESFEITLGMCLVVGCLLACTGLCMLPTIVWTLAGLKALWLLVTELEFLEPWYDNPARHPEQLVPLIAYGIIIGPDAKHALVLGSFLPSRECPPDWQAQLAKWCADVYTGNAADLQSHKELYDSLHDDNYRADRRVRVPERYAGSREVYFFDVQLNIHEADLTPFDTPVFAFAATPGEKGEIAALPWQVTQGAVRIL